MKYLFRKENRKQLLLLSLISLASQGLLLVVSGRWWDDWCSVDQSFHTLYDMAMQMGRPSVILTAGIAALLPESGYRYVTFLSFYFCMLFTCAIMKNWLKISDRACFWISALYSVIPANDARIMLSVFPYSIGLFFFMLAMYFASELLQKERISWIERGISWLFFFLGFTLNSTLVFYILVILMIIMKKGIKKLYRYIDYLFLPLVFFFAKICLFPAHGGYAEYNTVSLTKLISAVRSVISSDGTMMKTLFNNYVSECKGYKIYVVYILVVLLFAVINRKRIRLMLSSEAEKKDHENHECNTSIQTKILIFLIGFIALSAGILPYMVVRDSSVIHTFGIRGRDSTLVSFGSAMLFYALIELILEKRLRKYVYIWMIACGILFFNRYYLTYQRDSFRQLGFQYRLAEHREELEGTANVLYINEDDSLIDLTAFYELNGNAEKIFGDQSRFFINGLSTAVFLTDEQKELLEFFVESDNYHMSDYIIGHKRIDAIVQFSFHAELHEVLKMKLYELFDKNEFQRRITDHSEMIVLLDQTSEYEGYLMELGYTNLE